MIFLQYVFGEIFMSFCIFFKSSNFFSFLDFLSLITTKYFKYKFCRFQIPLSLCLFQSGSKFHVADLRAFWVRALFSICTTTTTMSLMNSTTSQMTKIIPPFAIRTYKQT